MALLSSGTVKKRYGDRRARGDGDEETARRIRQLPCDARPVKRA